MSVHRGSSKLEKKLDYAIILECSSVVKCMFRMRKTVDLITRTQTHTHVTTTTQDWSVAQR